MKYLFLAIYAVSMVFVAFFASKKTKTLSDFVLGGRNVGPWLSAFAYGTTYFSAVIFIGYAGKTGWNFGLSGTWVGIGNAVIGSLLAWFILAKRTRRLTHKWNVRTMPEFMEKRYSCKKLKIFLALVIFVFLVPYTASVYQGLGYLFEVAFGLPYTVCMIGMAAVTAIYLLAGGYFAAVLSDLIQGIFMLGGVAAMFVALFRFTGGVGSAIAQLQSFDPRLTGLVGPGGAAALLPLILLTSLGTWGLPQMVHKFYAIKDDAAVRRGTIISTVFALVIAGGAYLMGAFGRVVLQNVLPLGANGLANYDMIMPQMLMLVMPPVLLGLILVLVLSASMSTLSSLVLTSSSAIALDLVQGGFAPSMSDKKAHAFMRVLCVVFVAVSLVLALSRITGIITLMSYSWGAVAGATLGPYLFGLYWKRANRAGAWGGAVTGLAVTLILALLLPTSSAPLIGACAMIASIVAVPVVSLLTKPMPKAEIEALYAGE